MLRLKSKIMISYISCRHNGLQTPHTIFHRLRGKKKIPEMASYQTLNKSPPCYSHAVEKPLTIPGRQLHQDLLILPNTISFHLILSFPCLSHSNFLPPLSVIIIVNSG